MELIGFFVCAFFAVVFLLAFFITKADNEFEDKASGVVQSIADFDPKHVMPAVNVGEKKWLYFDFERMKVAIVDDASATVYDSNKLVTVEILRDGQSITKTTHGKQVAGAAAGALLLGPFGLLLGGLSGSKSVETQYINSIKLILVFQDFDNPTYSFEFILNGPLKIESIKFKRISKELNEWYGRFLAMQSLKQQQDTNE